MWFRQACRLLKPTGGLSRLQKIRFYAKIEDGLPDDRDTPQQTTQVNMLSADDDGCLYIHEYSDAGFTLRSGIKIFGPTVFFPRSYLSWMVKSTQDINDKSLSLFSMIHPKLDLLIIGKGDSSEEVQPGVIQYLRKNKLNFEILSAEQAMSTFNFLNKEQRWVAAAIIPPQFIYTQTQQDVQDYFAEKKREANMIIGGDEDFEKLEEAPKPIETNIFGYPILKSPLESSFTDVLEEANQAKKVGKNVKRPSKDAQAKEDKDDDPWADDDKDSTDISTDKKDK